MPGGLARPAVGGMLVIPDGSVHLVIIGTFMNGLPSRQPLAGALVFAILIAGGCGGGSDSGTPPSATAISKTSASNGDAQTGTVGQPLSDPIRVLVTEAGT